MVAQLAIAIPADAARPPLLRYQSDSNQTNILKTHIEITGENGTDVYAGNLVVTCKSGTSNVLLLTIRGSLNPRRDGPGRSPNYGFGPNSYRPLQPIHLNVPTEVSFDERGRILRVIGDPPLSVPLGSLAQLLIESFPAGSENRWEVTEDLAILDEPINLGPAFSFAAMQPYGMSYQPGFNNARAATIPVTRKTNYEIKSSTPSSVTVAKRASLESLLKTAGAARYSATSEGTFVFDRESGSITSAETQFKLVVNTENITRRTTGTVRITKLEGSQRDAALESTIAPLGRPAKKISPEEAQKLAEDLKSDNATTRNQAISKLNSAELTECPPALLETMLQLVTDSESMVQSAAAKIIADHGTDAQVPALLKLLKSGDTSTRWAAIRGLGRLKDNRAAEPLAAMIATGNSDQHQAVEALGKLGPAAEDAVLPLLKEKHIETRRYACNALKQIGTNKSLEALRELVLHPDQSLSSAASEAARAIVARQ
jgi:hypothetical protein